MAVDAGSYNPNTRNLKKYGESLSWWGLREFLINLSADYRYNFKSFHIRKLAFEAAYKHYTGKILFVNKKSKCSYNANNLVKYKKGN